MWRPCTEYTYACSTCRQHGTVAITCFIPAHDCQNQQVSLLSLYYGDFFGPLFRAREVTSLYPSSSRYSAAEFNWRWRKSIKLFMQRFSPTKGFEKRAPGFLVSPGNFSDPYHEQRFPSYFTVLQQKLPRSWTLRMIPIATKSSGEKPMTRYLALHPWYCIYLFWWNPWVLNKTWLKK